MRSVRLRQTERKVVHRFRTQRVNREVHTSQLALEWAKQQLEMGLKASDSLDTKAAGILAFEAVVMALVLPSHFSWWDIIPGVFAFLTIGFGGTLLLTRDFNYGTDVAEFYDANKYKHELLSTLDMTRGIQESFTANGKIIQQKSLWLNLAVAGMMGTVISAAIIYFVLGGERMPTEKTIKVPKPAPSSALSTNFPTKHVPQVVLKKGLGPVTTK